MAEMSCMGDVGLTMRNVTVDVCLTIEEMSWVGDVCLTIGNVMGGVCLTMGNVMGDVCLALYDCEMLEVMSVWLCMTVKCQR